MFLIIFLTFSFILSLFIGSHLYLAFGKFFPNKIIYWICVVVISQFYVVVRFLSRVFNFNLGSGLYFFSSTIFALMILAVIAILCVDIILGISKYTPKIKFIYNYAASNPEKIGYVCIIVILLQFLFGVYIAGNPKFTEYKLTTDKLAAGDKVRIVHISDVHVTSFTSVTKLKKTVELINSKKPDFVFITGDLIDDRLEPYVAKDINSVLSNLQSTYGTYYVTGNHEFYGGQINEITGVLSNAMDVLRDRTVELADRKITIVGRSDYAQENFYEFRKGLNVLTKGTNPENYLIILDHQPQADALADAEAAKADLMLSGHTHNGQFFPINFIVKKVYENPWGILRKGEFTSIVSCGYGTWGPPIRLASYSEIVLIDIESTK